MKFTRWNILSKTPSFQEYVIICQGGWVVSFPALSHFCHMSFFGGGGWVLKEIWSMSLNNQFFLPLPLVDSPYQWAVYYLARLPGPDNSLYFRGLKLPGPGVATTYTQHTEV